MLRPSSIAKPSSAVAASGAVLYSAARLWQRHSFRATQARCAPRSNWRAEIEAGITDDGLTATAPAVEDAATATANDTQPTATGYAATASSFSPPPPPPPAAAAAPPVQEQEQQPASALLGRAESLSLPALDISGFLANPVNQSTAFAVLAATSAVFATLCFVEPGAVLDLALPQADYSSDLDVTFVRIGGVTLAASVAVEWSLKHAASSQLLASATYQRLMTGAAVRSAVVLVVLLTAAAAGQAAPAGVGLWWAAVAAAASSVAVNLAVISHTSGRGLALPPLEPAPPCNPTSAAYLAVALLYLATVAACMAPEALFTGDPPSSVTPLLKALWMPGFTLAAVISLVLKDASDRGRLGASTFKNLNLGLAALEYGYSVVFCSAILSDQVNIGDPAALGNLAGSLLVATFAFYVYATAKK